MTWKDALKIIACIPFIPIAIAVGLTDLQDKSDNPGIDDEYDGLDDDED